MFASMQVSLWLLLMSWHKNESHLEFNAPALVKLNDVMAKSRINYQIGIYSVFQNGYCVKELDFLLLPPILPVCLHSVGEQTSGAELLQILVIDSHSWYFKKVW